MLLEQSRWIICVSALLLARLAARGRRPGNGRTLYKWVDDQGVTHYGDHVPPEYAGQEQHIINSQGVEIGTWRPRKPPSSWPPKTKRAEAEQEARRATATC